MRWSPNRSLRSTPGPASSYEIRTEIALGAPGAPCPKTSLAAAPQVLESARVQNALACQAIASVALGINAVVLTQPGGSSKYKPSLTLGPLHCAIMRPVHPIK